MMHFALLAAFVLGVLVGVLLCMLVSRSPLMMTNQGTSLVDPLCCHKCEKQDENMQADISLAQKMHEVLQSISKSRLMNNELQHQTPETLTDILREIRRDVCNVLEETVQEQQSTETAYNEKHLCGKLLHIRRRLKRVFHTMKRVTGIFVTANYFTLTIAVAAGLSMQLLFVTFTGPEGISPDSTFIRLCNLLAFITLPVIIMLSGLLVHVACCLVIDACRVPGFVKCRASLLMLCKHLIEDFKDEKELENLCAAVDLYFSDFLFLLFVAGSFLGGSASLLALLSLIALIPISFVIGKLCKNGQVLNWRKGRVRILMAVALALLVFLRCGKHESRESMWAGIFLGGLAWSNCTTLLYGLARLHARLSEEAESVNRFRDLLRIRWIEAGSMASKGNFKKIRGEWQGEPGRFENDRFGGLSCPKPPGYLLWSSSFWIASVFFATVLSWRNSDESWGHDGYLLVVAALIWFLHDWSTELLFSPKTSIKRLSPYTAWVFISCTLLITGFVAGQFTNSSKPDTMEALMRFGNQSALTSPSSSPSPYPACKMSWGSPTAPLQILDLAALSAYAYLSDKDNYTQRLNETFGKRAVLVHWSNYTTFPRVIGTRFKSDKDGGSDTVVLAVKGTSGAVDFFTDASFYAMVALLQMSGYVVDFLDFVPNTMIADFVDFFKLSWLKEGWIFEQTDIVKQTLIGNSTIIFTGHSLGGGIATAIGAKMNYPTIVFSAPGGHFGRERLGHVSREQMYRNVFNVIPDEDLVPKVDRHDATVQKIVCMWKKGDSYATPGFPSCHEIHSTLCELWRACGDPLGRDFSSCSFNNTDRFRYLTHDV